MELRDYQAKAINDIFGYLCTHPTGNPVVIAPTGSGKSIIIAATILQALMWWPGTRILVVTHQKELVEQDYEKLRILMPEADTGIYSASIGKKEDNHQVTFASIQSIYKRTDLLYDIILVDECHLINNDDVGTYRSYLGIQYGRIVGFTATPYRLGQGEIVEEGSIFTDYIETVSIYELQRRGYLSRLVTKATAFNYDVSNVHLNHGEFDSRELDATVNTFKSNDAVSTEIVDSLRRYDRHHCLVFCTSVDHAYNIASLLESKGIKASTVEGSLSKADREARINAFKSGEVEVLTNCSVLTTGFDYPAIDCIVMLSATMSTGRYVQVLGRGLRIAEEKKDCLVLDFAGNVRRHGPITEISVSDLAYRRKGQGVPPMKTCPECLELISASARFCPQCGHEFPKHSAFYHLFFGDVNGTGNPDGPKGMFVQSWAWKPRSSKAGNPMFNVTYFDVFGEKVDEYLVYGDDYSSFAVKKTYERMKLFCSMFNLDMSNYIDRDGYIDWDSLYTAVAHAGPPAGIVTQKDGKYNKVIKIYSEKEFNEETEAERLESEIRMERWHR